MKRSAGVLLYRQSPVGLEVLLVRPGGPFWRNKDRGAWQIPKGEFAEGEEPAACALREVQEELGVAVTAPLRPLAEIRQAGGKQVTAFAAEQDIDSDAIVSNTFPLEWPPRSGRIEQFPEVESARWLTIEQARLAILPSQELLLDRLEALLR
jgi:predicted NUDIX family NTP pyrophosphohydrolase